MNWMPMWMRDMPLWKKQAQALDTVIRRGDLGTGLWIEMGCGKTRIMIEALEQLRKKADVRLVLITAPLSVLHVWIENYNDWVDEPVLFFDLHKLGPRGLRKAERMAKEGCFVVCLINYEATWQFGHKRVTRIRRGEEVKILEPVDTTLYDVQWDAIIADEITAIKNASSKVSKFFIKKLRPVARYRYGLSGSAYVKRPLDVYAPLKFLTGDKYMPANQGQFKVMYTIPHPHIRGAIVGYQNIPSLVKRMSRCCVLLKKEEVLDLPPVVHTKRYIEIPPKVMKLYKEVTDEMFAELIDFEDTGGTVTAAHIFSIIRKQTQMASGFVKPDQEPGSDEKPVPVFLHDLKVKACLDILDVREGKPTVFVVQNNEMERMLSEAFKKRYDFVPKILNGSVKGAEARHEMIKAASRDPAFIVKERVGCKGVDMRWSDMLVFVEHGTNTDDYIQMLARNHRGGQTEKITYVHILALDTADIRIWNILENDLKMAELIERNWRKFL